MNASAVRARSITKMTQFELWIRGCEINKTNVFCLGGSGDNGFYKLNKPMLVNNNYFFDTPVYIVWKHGRQACATTNYQDALHCWRKEK